MSNVIITGASKGIGRALAIKFAQNGHHLALCSRDSKNLEILVGELKSINSNIQIIAIPTDVSIKEKVEHFASEILNQWDKIDVLINNAGVFIPGSIHDEPEGNLEIMMNTNLFSAYHLTRKIIPSMIANKAGYIFNICSIASFTAYANGGSYAISKFALLGFSKCLREELKQHQIKVSSVMPGATLTASWDGVDLPEERFIPAEDIADIVYNTSQLSSRTVVEDIVIRPQLGDL